MATLMDKKISELTADELKSLAKPVGVESLPYPMMMVDKDARGRQQMSLGIVDEIANGMTIYTELSQDKVWGKLFRDMPIPSMLLLLRDLLAKSSPSSKNRLLSVFGDPAFGKSYLFKMVAGLVHPEGAKQIDCGGMNMHEIFFRTVIDYGVGVKEVLNDRLASGNVSKTTIEFLNDAFPGSVVTKGGKSVIDWDMIGVPKTEPASDDGKVTQIETYEEATGRAAKVLKDIYDKEGITHQNNSFGIKTVPGDAIEAFWKGQPLFLDEFNKSKLGTLDSMQVYLQFLNGEEDSVTILNPMAQSGSSDDLKSITLTRADIKPGFFVGLAGNMSKDGNTTQKLTESMLTRIDPQYILSASPADWEHRTSQIWTGLPLSTLYTINQKWADQDADGFAEYLLSLRKMGLSPQEVKAIPPQEIYWLQNWPDTLQAVRQYAALEKIQHDLADPESALFEAKGPYTKLADEITSSEVGKEISTSFRTVIRDRNKAVQGTPSVRSYASAVVKPSISDALNPANLMGKGAPEPGWHHFGQNLANAVIESIMNVTQDKPETRKALMELCKTYGVLPEALQEAKQGDLKLLPALLKYDALHDKGLGNSDELKALQSVIMMALRAINPKIQSTDDDTVPLESLGRAVQALDLGGQKTKQMVAPNDDLNEVVQAQPLMAIGAVPSYSSDSAYEKAETVDFRVVLAAMALPGYAEENLKKVWLDDLLAMLEATHQAPETAEEEEVFKVLMGASKSGLNMVVAEAKDSSGKPVYLYIVEDVNGKGAEDVALDKSPSTMVIGPEEIPSTLKATLAKNGVMYVVRSDSGSAQTIDGFLTEKVDKKYNSAETEEGTATAMLENLIHAFGRACVIPAKYMSETEDGELEITDKLRLSDLILSAEDKPSICTRFIRMPKAGM